MRRLRRYIPILALLLAGCMTSCRHSGISDSLQHAEELMETDPHAARAVLDSLARATSPWQLGIRNEELGINPADENPADESHAQPVIPNSSFLIPNFPRKGEAADYAWLRTQIDYKCLDTLCSDSLALVATCYYGTPRRPDYHAAMAWYTLGCVYTDMHQTEDAFAAYLKAQRIFPTAANRYYSLCEQNIGKCYLDRNMNDEAILAFRRCRESAVSIGDSAEIAWSDFFLGRCYLYEEEYDKADSLFRGANENSHAATAIRKRVLFERSKISHYRDGDYAEALRLLRSFVRQVNNPAYFGAAWTQMANSII